MQNTRVRELFINADAYYEKEIQVSGWIRTSRSSKSFGFIEIGRAHV